MTAFGPWMILGYAGAQWMSPPYYAMLCSTMWSLDHEWSCLPPIVTVVVALFVPASIVCVVDVVIKALDSANILTDVVSHTLWKVFNIVDGVVEAVLHSVLDTISIVLDVLRNIFNLSDLDMSSSAMHSHSNLQG